MALPFSPLPAVNASPPAASALRKKGGCYSWTLSPVRVRSHRMVRCSTMASRREKMVWVWTESRQVMTAAVERGWNSFLFPGSSRDLAQEWSSIALIHPLIMEGSDLFNRENERVASFYEVSSSQQLEQLQPGVGQVDNLVINLQGGWQVIPAENIVAAFQGCRKTVLAIATSYYEAQVFLEALEHGVGGVVLKVEDVDHILKLKEYFDRINEVTNLLSLQDVSVTRVQIVGMGDRVCVDLCSIMQPGEGLLVGSFARGLFLVHSECLESNYIASRPFRVNAGPVHAYVAVPGGKTCYLSELHAGKEVIVVDQKGHQRTAIVGRVKVESRPLILVEAKNKISERAMELLALPDDGVPWLLLDIGCGSGLSGETISESGHHWIGLDISQAMLGAIFAGRHMLHIVLNGSGEAYAAYWSKGFLRLKNLNLVSSVFKKLSY